MIPSKIGFIKLIVVGIVIQSQGTVGQYAPCNLCSLDSGMACVSETQFQICDANGLPSGPLNSCPTGYSCSTEDARICKPTAEVTQVDCSSCNVCDATNTFACTGPRTYALCLGGTTASSATGTCSADLVCSLWHEQICGNSSMGFAATCSFYDAPTTVPTSSTIATTKAATTPMNADTYCRMMKQNKRYPVGTDLATTCRQYYLCRLNDAIWYGTIYTCPGSTYFNAATLYCDTAIPTRCTTTAQG